ncbi:MAG: hypothetical protein ACLU3I_09400 [Acutalibacteraceae bacterium]
MSRMLPRDMRRHSALARPNQRVQRRAFSDSFRTKVETTAEDRTQSAFDAEKPKRTSTKKKRKKKGRVIIGICAICLLIPAVLYVTGILPDPYYSFIHNIFEPQPIPEALQEFEDAGTLEKIYENGRLTGYRVETYGHGEHIATDIFDTAGNNIRNEIYNSDGTIYGYDQYEYDSKGTEYWKSTTIRMVRCAALLRLNMIRAEME